MNIKQAVEIVRTEIKNLTPLPLNSVIAGGQDDESQNFKITIELIEKRSIPDGMDLLGLYDVVLDSYGDFIYFERKGVRRRCDIVPSEGD
jgi:hypothetical protein